MNNKNVKVYKNTKKKKKTLKKVEPIIICLRVKRSDLNNNILYNNTDNNYINLDLEYNDEPSKINTAVDDKIINDINLEINPNIDVYDDNNIIKKNVHNIMCEYIESKNKHKWPDKTNICCFWDTKKFTTVPIAIPIKYENGIFYVKENFCSFNCALAQIYKNNDYNKSEQISLLYLLYKKMNNTDKIIKIKPSPSPMLLKKFGGKWNITEYRNYLMKNTSNYKLIQPPLVPVIPKIEESILRMPIVTNDYILKRNKPLLSKEKTLLNYTECAR